MGLYVDELRLSQIISMIKTLNYICKMLNHKKYPLRKFLYHSIFWIGLFLLTFLSLYRYGELLFSFQFSLVLIGPLIIPTYFHAYIFERFFQKKKYYFYVIITLIIILCFGYFNSWLLTLFHREIKSETYLTLTIFMFMYPGLKYLRIGTKTQFKLDLEEKKRIKAENELLKSQVNPHFMFNTLNSIYSLIISKDSMSGEAVLKLSGLMRYMLEDSKNKTVSLKQEYDFLQNYIDLERIRLNDMCKIKFDFIGDFKGKYIAPMLFIPFVENAFKHGISAQSGINYINIVMISENHEVSLHVENRIATKSNIPVHKQNKIGIDNVTQRLDLQYPGKHTLQISEEDDIYIVDLRIVLSDQ